MRAFLDWAGSEHGCCQKDGGYLAGLSQGGEAFVVGKYDVPTGGCDTIHDVKALYETIYNLQSTHNHVLFEGLFVMNMTRGPQLAEELGKNLVLLQLTTPLATCIASINSRRAEKGKGLLENKANTQDNYRRATNYCAKMRDAGARVIKVSREEGLGKILELLGEK